MIHARRITLLVLLCLLALPLSAQDQTLYDIALERIEFARSSEATELNLTFLELTELPPEIGQLANLQILALDSNLLSALPPEIGQLVNLQTLAVTDNQLSALPPQIGQLTNLKGLYLYANQLSVLPSEIGQLANLQVLYLSTNRLSTLPLEIVQLDNLYTLTLDDNQFSSLPPEIGQLEQLCRLDLSHNRLRELPTELGYMTYPAKLDQECVLWLEGNPLISPPPEVVAQGTPAILDYLRNQAGYHTRQMISGAGGVSILAGVLLLARWRYRRLRKPKKKNEAAL